MHVYAQGYIYIYIYIYMEEPDTIAVMVLIHYGCNVMHMCTQLLDSISLHASRMILQQCTGVAAMNDWYKLK